MNFGEPGLFPTPKFMNLYRTPNVSTWKKSASPKNNYFTEMCSGSEAGSYLRLIDFVYHSTLSSRVIKKKKREGAPPTTSTPDSIQAIDLYRNPSMPTCTGSQGRSETSSQALFFVY